MARATPPAVYFCRREDLANVTLPMPFHPDDLIQVLGSVPLDPKKFHFEKGFDSCVTLVSSETAPSGEPVVKRIVVDRRTGRALAFEVWNLQGDKPRILAEARILNYHDDPSGAFLPQKVKLLFPDAKTDLTLVMRSRSIEINQIDSQWAASLFSRGNYINSQVVDLGAEYRKRQASLETRPSQLVSAHRPQLVNYETENVPFAVPKPIVNPSSQVVDPPSQAQSQAQPIPTAIPASKLNAVPALGSDEGVPELFDGIKPGGYRSAGVKSTDLVMPGPDTPAAAAARAARAEALKEREEEEEDDLARSFLHDLLAVTPFSSARPIPDFDRPTHPACCPIVLANRITSTRLPLP